MSECKPNGGTIASGLAAMGLMFGLAAFAPAAAITDGFGDGDRDNDGTPEGAVEDAADVGLKWYAIEGSSPPPKPTFTVVTDPTGLNSGNALYATARGSGSEAIGVLPSTVSLGNQTGDQIVMSLRFRIDGNSPHGIPTGTNGSFRIGLYNDIDNQLGTAWGTGDSDSDDTHAANDPGWYVRVPIGGVPGADVRVFEEAGDNGAILAGSGGDADFVAGPDDVVTGIVINDALVHTIQLVLERVDGGGVRATLTVDNSSITGVETDINTTTFHYVAMVNASQDFDYLIDDFSIEAIAVPEPALAGLLPIAALAGLRRRR